MLRRQGTMLALLMLLPTVLGRDTPVDKNFTIKRVESCPVEGYYFRRELAPNSVPPGLCYLCFCQNDGTAICWRRENRRCDLESYHYHNVGKRESRVKRGAALGNIVLRDVARDSFKTKVPKQCKPYESSFSDDCPPEDWCTGCTVCDCNRNGRWDCHVLSFCPNKTKQTHKFSKVRQTRTVIRKLPKAGPTAKNAAKYSKKSKKRGVHKPVTKDRQKKYPHKNHNKDSSKKVSNKRKNPAPKKSVKKNVIKNDAAKTPSTDPTKQILLPTSPKLAQAAVRKMMAAVHKMMKNDLKKGNSSRIVKAVIKNNVDNVKKVGQNSKGRSKREIDVTVDDLVGVNASKTHSLPTESTPRMKIVVENNTNNSSYSLQTSASSPNSIQSTTNTSIAILDSDDNYIPYITKTKILPMTTIVDRNYYSYLNKTETTNERSTTVSLGNTNLAAYQQILKNSTTDDFTNLITSSTTKADTEIKSNNMIYLIDHVPIGNDLKFKKWSQIKLLKDKAKNYNIELVKSKNLDSIFSAGRTDVAKTSGKSNGKAHVKESVRKLGVPRKYNISRLVNTSKTPMNQKSYGNITNIFYINNKITRLQNIVKNLLQSFHRNNTETVKRRTKHFNILKYMRKLFRKIFHSRQIKSPNRLLYHNHIIKTLCESLGSCKISKRDGKLVKLKVELAHLEIKKILKTINLIKGLLHLIDLSPNISDKITKTKSNFNNDILKLNSILKDTYNANNTKYLTQTQLVQIEYIKKNTQEFVESIGKFASLLNEIIAILTKSKQSSINNKHFHKPISEPLQTESNKNAVFTRIKKLLLKYDIIHNAFIRRMYDVITSFGPKINKEKRAKVNLQEESNNVASINNYSNNIITNLRKLTHLAQSLNSRQKREVERDDDAIEYLLMLMEYLLKKNYPVDTAPVNDGIDLLLESIKHAPDIKTTRKKVQEDTHLPIIVTRTMRPIEANELTTENLSDSIKIAQEDNHSNIKSNSKLHDVKFTEEVDDDIDYDDKFTITKKSVDNSESALYRSEDKSTTMKLDVDTTTEINVIENEIVSKSEVSKSFYKIKQEYKDTDDSRNNEINNFDSDNNNQATEITTSKPDIEIHLIDQSTSKSKLKDEEDSSASESRYRSPKLDWVDKEAKDYKDYKRVSLPVSTPAITRATTTPKAIEENISAISNEQKLVGKTKKYKINIKDVIHEKQMDLLNSLDYGNDTTNVTNDDSKDVIADRYSGDTFAAYFV